MAGTVEHGIEYARRIRAGDIPAAEPIRLAADKFLRELDTQPDGYRFDAAKAQQVMDVMQIFNHTKGSQHAGKPFTLEPWQCFVIANVFGWLDSQGLRRFSKAFISVPRKNGKSTLAAAVMLYMMFADGEASADCYTAATKMDQAKIIFDEAYRMAKDSMLGDEFKYANSDRMKYIRYGRNELRPLVSEYKTLDGLNPHAVALDEYHAHRNDDLLNVLLTGMGARSQPLMFIVTTAGFNRNSPAKKYEDYCMKVLRGHVDDPHVFAAIYTINKEDDWKDESSWWKANPNLEVSVQLKKLRADLMEAKEMHHKAIEFKTKYLNIWTDSAVAWLTQQTWDTGNQPFDIADLQGLKCYGGLDLASTGDFTSFARVWDGGDRLFVKVDFWLPEEAIEKRTDATGDQIRAWANAGLIHIVPGNATEYTPIVNHIIKCHAEHPIESIAYDRWNANQPVAMLTEKGFKLAGFGQGFGSMSAPSKEVERLAMRGELIHGGNPVLAWQVGNVMLSKDAAGNIKPDKAKAGDKIDGVVAMVMAVGELMDYRMQERPAEFWAF